MIPKLSPLMLAALLGLTTLDSQAQTARAVLDHNARAMGGAKQLARITTRTVEGDLLRPRDGRTGLYTEITTAQGERFEELTLGQQILSDGFNGKSAWRRDESNAPATLTGDQALLAAAVALARNPRRIRSSSQKGMLPRLAGPESARGHQVFRIEFAGPPGVRRTVLIDCTTYLILEERFDAGRESEAILYDDYVAVDGVLEPRQMEFRQGGESWVATNIRVKYNEGSRLAAFNFPDSSSVPIANVAQLLQEAQENQARIDGILEDYAYTKTEQESDTDDQGRPKNIHEREYEVFYVKGWEIEKLTARDGKPLPPEEKAKEEDRVKRLILKYDASRPLSAAERAKKNENADELQIGAFLRASRFTHPRREHFRGEEVIVFEMEPNPQYEPRNATERLIQKVAGVMWVDDRTHQVVRLQARLDESAGIAGGLLGSIQKGSSAVFEQRLVNGEVWLPAYLEEHLFGRYLLFKKFRDDLVIRYGDYRKFRVETKTEVKPP